MEIKKLDFAITVTILSKHKLNYGYTLSRKDKRLYNDLTESEQDSYLGWLLTSCMRMTLDEVDITHRLSYRFENHPAIKLKGGHVAKRHVHGILYSLSEDEKEQYRQYIIKYLKISHSEKWSNICVMIVPIFYQNGWVTYMDKDTVLLEMEKDLLELEFPPSDKKISPIDVL